MDLKKHTRRDFLRLAGLSTAGVIVAACAGQPEVVEKVVKETVEVVKEVEKQVTVVVEKEVEATKPPEAAPSKYKESPMLAERVAAGELPPVDERLPEEPLVIEPYASVGQYGGTATTGGLSVNLYHGDTQQLIGRPNHLRISKDLTHAVPLILKDWTVSDDFREVTCFMRKGMKWSDGEPLTTADIKFWYEDVLQNTELTPLAAIQFRWGDELMKMEFPDDFTYKITFKAPNPSFVLVCMAHLYAYWDHNGFMPSHYLKQFHIKYNDKAGDLAKAEGFDFWYQLFNRQNYRNQNIERPKLESFINVTDSPQSSVLERNPYYLAVDPEGNQLPYIDKIVNDKCADLSILDAKTVGGQYDFCGFELRILSYATYDEGAKAANAHMTLWQSGKGSEVVYNVNCNWKDEEWRNVFMDDRFRQALSLAINRADINNVIYFGNATETQMTVIPVSRHYKPEYAAAYAEFDLDKANALLDEMGLEWNAARTHRTWPVSKKDIVIPWDLYESETPKGPMTELVAEHWKAIGIEIQWKSVTRTLLSQKIQANEEPMSLWHGDETADTLFLRRPKYFAPIGYSDENCWGQLWGQWYNTRGEQGEEPPQYIKDLYTWLDEYQTNDSNEPARKVLESQAEHVWTIGSVGNAPQCLWVRNTLKNVSETGGFWTWDSLWTFPECPEMWYFEQ
ncbi:MAG: ABC transporter substrate-binding protein [Anaerolineae bacterium]